ncbi:TrmB family transcriptional regulator [Haloferax volcanii]|uniref:Transcriptional regulator, TrmB n=3 Tax=Haloferacaceae TaxID=1644056 RepID=M0GYV0_HALL2|nr:MULTISPECIES: helix-turn-helix domain-containing protein [Haloferax]ELZ76682.1 transcriptional regulator, TrmB [Haloferax lucentense DSM 14919]NLV02942.1 TrmB family transcriptional regulator [Haloferax alexandrinus]
MSELAELGLSSYEEKVYRSLLVTGAVTATELSDISGVPKGRIYDVLNNLKARKLIETQSNDPKQYVAVQPETAVDILLAEKTHEMAQEWNHHLEAAKTVRSNLLPTPPTKSSFWCGSLGSDEMSTALQQHMRSAENSVHAVMGTPYENSTWETFQTEIEAFFEGANSGLTVDLLLSEKVVTVLPDRFPSLIDERSVDVTVRTISDVALSFDVIDQVETTIDLPHPVTGGDRIGVVGIKDSKVVEEFEKCFQQLWTNADPLI